MSQWGYYGRQFRTEAACERYLAWHRWEAEVRCPRCGNGRVYALKRRRRHYWQCHRCSKSGYRFSVTTGTILENTKIPLRRWFYLIDQVISEIDTFELLAIRRVLPQKASRTIRSVHRRLGVVWSGRLDHERRNRVLRSAPVAARSHLLEETSSQLEFSEGVRLLLGANFR